MQARDQNDIDTQDDLTKKVEQQLELSEAWRQLLGLEAQPAPSPSSLEAAKATGAVNQEAVPVLSHDPWNFLARERGIQIVDLQQAHVHKAQASGEESDVEHALDMMQEQEKKSEK
ncbi:MAG TPA: hypothetical protein VIZ18_07925 [Ktedonobacteraceae bacterium]